LRQEFFLDEHAEIFREGSWFAPLKGVWFVIGDDREFAEFLRQQPMPVD
jgi:hypothetical protein